jgi:hypothetical protein
MASELELLRAVRHSFLQEFDKDRNFPFYLREGIQKEGDDDTHIYFILFRQELSEEGARKYNQYFQKLSDHYIQHGFILLYKWSANLFLHRLVIALVPTNPNTSQDI